MAATRAAGALTRQSAVIIRASLPAGLERLRRQNVDDAADGLPAHLTLLYPFVDPADLTLATRRTLTRVARGHASFAYALRGMADWPDTIYVAVEPTAPFARLQHDLQAAFPDYPIYGRDATFRFVPHVTVAEGPAVADPAIGADPGWEALPQAREATSIEVIASGADGTWRTVWRIRLGGVDRAIDRMLP
jgi:2'-5' RNA ligase